MEITASNNLVDDLDVLIVANFTSPANPGNSRFVDLARRFTSMGASVELVTSNFEHGTLSPRQYPTKSEGYKVTFVPEPGYHKNISVKRLISQHRFGQSIRRYLKQRATVPDLIYCATPPPGAAGACADYAREHNVPFVVDIQDLWPEAFSMHFRHPRVINLLFKHMIRASQRAYRTADLVVAVSQTYIDNAEQVAKKSLPTSVVFLGTTIDPETASAANDPAMQNGRTGKQIAYAGTLSHSYDLPLVIDAMASLAKQDTRFAELELVVLGDGPLKSEFETYSRNRNVRATFHGKVPYRQMLQKLQEADVAVNPIVAGSAGSVLNKVGDYAAAALPVINTQESPEYRQLLDKYSAGINCRTGNASDVAEAIRKLVDEPQLRHDMGCNSLRIADELFDRNKTYDALVKATLSLAQQRSR